MARFIFALALLLLSGCTHMSRPWHPKDVLLAERAWPYAQIAYNSYHREVANPAAQPFQLPHRFHLAEHNKHDNDDIGLAYDILTEDVHAALFDLIFAFRGTEGRVDLLGIAECDWKFGNHRLHQQERAVGMVRQYLADPDNHKRGARRLRDVILVGHSLGGAIAIHTGYRVPGAWVYAFNTSPRFLRPRPYRRSATDEEDRRLSIADRLEVLKALRTPAGEATQLYLPVNCSRGDPLKRHSMLALASCLTRVAAGEGQGAGASEAAKAIEGQPDQYLPTRARNDADRDVPRCRD